MLIRLVRSAGHSFWGVLQRVYSALFLLSTTWEAPTNYALQSICAFVRVEGIESVLDLESVNLNILACGLIVGVSKPKSIRSESAAEASH